MDLETSELNILNILWDRGDTAAAVIYKLLEEQVGWNKSTTYTVIKRCIDKGYVERLEPGYICRAVVKKEEMQNAKITNLLSRFFSSKSDFFKAFLQSEAFTKEEIEELESLIDELKLK